jgi:outer membrane receptor for ferrienterochelin and colicins
MRFLVQFIAAALIVTGSSMATAAQVPTETETEMEKTVVTATRTEVSLKDAPGAITIVTAEEIKDIAANDILDIVRETAGVSLVGRGVGGRTVISIRGLDSRQTMILIDGKRVPASDPVFGHSDYEQNWIPIEAITMCLTLKPPFPSRPT